jgi:nucleotide-binding universal stress UspA family protein
MPFKRILIAVDGSEISTYAARLGLALAASIEAKVALLHVIGPTVADSSWYPVASGELMQPHDEEVAQVFAGLGGSAPIPEDAEKLIGAGPPGTAILQAARDWSADLVVLGSHGREGLERALFGSIAEEVARQAPCPVLVVPQQ